MGEVRAFPASRPAEADLLGMLLLDPSRLSVVVDAGLESSHFYVPQYGALFAELERRISKDEPHDMVSLGDWLIRHPQLGTKFPDIGDFFALPDKAGPGVLARTRAESIMDDARRRALLAIMAKGSAEAAQGHLEVNEIIETVLTALHREEVAGPSGKRTDMGYAIECAIEDAVIASLEGRCAGMPYGYYALDHLTGGVQRGEVVVVAGRTSMGKTAFAMDVARKAAHRNQGHVVVYSLEDTQVGLARRNLAAATGIDSHRIRTGDLDTTEIERLRGVLERSQTSGVWGRLHVVAKPDLSMARIEADLVQRLQRGDEIGLVVIDYLQLVRPPKWAMESRQQQVSAVSNACKIVAARCEVPILALAQLNRETANRKGKLPELTDLRESGSIEQDADAVLFIHRPGYYTTGPATDGDAQVVVAKNRHGKTGAADLWFSGGHFHDGRPDHHGEWQ